jgi:hypothetical protein
MLIPDMIDSQRTTGTSHLGYIFFVQIDNDIAPLEVPVKDVKATMNKFYRTLLLLHRGICITKEYS